MFSRMCVCCIGSTRNFIPLLFLLIGLILLSREPSIALAQGGPYSVSKGPRVAPKEFRGDVRTLPQLPPDDQAPLPLLDIPANPNQRQLPSASEPQLVPPPHSPTTMPAPIVSFKGLSRPTWGICCPPDPVGDVGPSHYIQAVNIAVGIFSKTGSQLAAFTFNSLWAGAGSGTACDTTHRGDPTVVYDHLADRFYVADFAFSGSTSTPPFYECIAVSKTSDPVAGGWWLYAIRTDDAAHPWLADYPKMGLWSDGLYMTANMYQGSFTFREVRVWAFDRTDLIAGAPVDMVIVDLNTDAYFSLLPSNLRGALPPAGRENLLVSNELPTSTFAWEVWKFHVDYEGPGSTFTGPINVSQASYSPMSAIVETPAGSLDSVRERAMMQNQYRNIGGVESLWLNHTVRAISFNFIAGIQWAQINVTGGTVVTTPVQEQNYGNLSNDNVSRWMGSLAVDKNGNMALGYSAASDTVYPDIRYNGRLALDSLNTLPQGEISMLPAPPGATQSGTSRWGDYSAMTVDPNGCDFWYTNEYYETNGQDWQTRIGSFRFSSCAPTAATLISFDANATNAKRVRLKWETGSELNVVGFHVWRATKKEGTYKKLNDEIIYAKHPGTIQGAAYSFKDKQVKQDKRYFYKLEILAANGPSEWSDIVRITIR